MQNIIVYTILLVSFGFAKYNNESNLHNQIKNLTKINKLELTIAEAKDAESKSFFSQKKPLSSHRFVYSNNNEILDFNLYKFQNEQEVKKILDEVKNLEWNNCPQYGGEIIVLFEENEIFVIWLTNLSSSKKNFFESLKRTSKDCIGSYYSNDTYCTFDW